MKRRFNALLVGVLFGIVMWTVAMLYALAATPSVFTVNWQAPTQYEDGSTISGAITYQLYVGPSGQEVKFGNSVTASPYVITPTPKLGVTTCVQVTATVNGVESARPTEVCGTVPYPPPKAPATTTITIK